MYSGGARKEVVLTIFEDAWPGCDVFATTREGGEPERERVDGSARNGGSLNGL